MQSTHAFEKLIYETPPLVEKNKAWTNFFHQNQWSILTVLLLANDVATIGLSFLAAYIFRFRSGLPVFDTNAYISMEYYLLVFCALIILWLVIFAFMGLYNRHKLLGGVQEYSLVFYSTIIGLALVLSTGFLVPTFVLARGWLLSAWPLTFMTTLLGRFSLRRLIYYLRRRGFYLTPAVIIGANDEGLSLAQQLTQWKTSGLHLVGFIDKKIQPGTPVLGYLTVLSGIEELDVVVQQQKIEELIIASSAISSRDHMQEIFQRFGVSKNVNLRISSGFYEIFTTGLTVKEFAAVPFVCVNKVRLAGIDRFLKLMLDYALALPGMLLISPLMLLIAIAVKLDSPGPVVYRRRVMGVNGRQFDAFKFRTMVLDGDAILREHPELVQELAANHKLKHDPRVTRVGSILRKMSLDELPQLINVLKGDMSLVGPRMITPDEVEKYDKWDMNLMTVRPGITGLWQVSGRSDVSYEERVRLDMYYIRNWSIWSDLELLMRTIPAVLSRRGAY